MTRHDRLRKKLLQELVRENLETIQGLAPRSLRRHRRAGRLALRGLRLVIVPTLLFLSISALSTGGSERPWAPPAAPGLSSFPAPQRIDPAAFPLSVKRIVLDPGHGGVDPGAPTASGVWEKEITLDLARRLRTLLEKVAFEVVMTREADQTVSLRQRALFANAQRGDLFVSIHVNSMPDRDMRGVETYYLGPTNDPRVERLAGVENLESGYSLADFRRLLEGVYVHARQSESRRLAELVQERLVTTLSKSNPGLRNHGVKSAPLLVLVSTEMPGILAEVSFLSNDQEARLLADPGYRQSIVRGLFGGIVAYATARRQPGGKGSL